MKNSPNTKSNYSSLQNIIIFLLACTVLYLWSQISIGEQRVSQHIEESHKAITTFISNAEKKMTSAAPVATVVSSSQKELDEAYQRGKIDGKTEAEESAKATGMLQVGDKQISMRGSKRTDVRESMEKIGGRTGTDKVLHHGYERFYPFFLEHLREKPVKMLEIGYLNGK